MQWSKFWCSLLLTCRDWNISSSYCRVRKTDSNLYTWSGREYLIIYCWYQHEKNDGSILCSYSKHSCCTLTIYDVRGLTPVDYPSWENFSGWFVQQTANPFFVSSVLVKDEANFMVVSSWMSTINSGVQRRIHMIQSMINTSSSSKLMCGLVLRVTIWKVHMFCLNILTCYVYRDFLLNSLSRLL